MINLTPEILEAAYKLLCETPPFKSWKLPDSDEVEFMVNKSTTRRGDHIFSNDTHSIGISTALIGSLNELLVTMAHEMCHMKHEIDAPNDPAHHGSRFKSYADKVCRAHNFDRRAF